jgi:hypothetical protein
MARNVDDIIKTLPISRRRKIEKRASRLIAEEMTLQELRRAREMEALGGTLSLVAEFPDRDPVVLAGISALDV